MTEKREHKKRMMVQVDTETYEKIKAISDKRHVSMSAIFNLSLASGLLALEMSMNPKWQAVYESQLTDEKIKELEKM